MTNETRTMNDEQIKYIFAQTERTHDLTVTAIEYEHYENFSDRYIVHTTNGKYVFQIATKAKHKTAFTNSKEQFYNRIVKIGK